MTCSVQALSGQRDVLGVTSGPCAGSICSGHGHWSNTFHPKFSITMLQSPAGPLSPSWGISRTEIKPKLKYKIKQAGCKFQHQAL